MKAPRPPLLRPLEIYAGRRVLVAVSGGADSVALLRALVEVGARPMVAHLDHALRPESAGDARFVEDLSRSLGLDCAVQRVDVGAVVARRGWNLEDGARRLRYSFLTRTARTAGLQTLLTAHTRSDQAETVVWQLLRGEATLRGMPARNGHLERPWLDVGRAEILGYLAALEQPWREDASNGDLSLTRNWLRREILPALEGRFPALEAALARLARLQAQDDDALEAAAQRLTRHAPLGRVPLAVLRRYVRRELAGQAVHAVHLEQIAGALRGGGTLHLTLPGPRPLSVTAGRLVPRPLPAFPRPDFAVPLHWTLRHPQPGDRLQLSGGTRKLSDALTDLKVPRDHRPALWLLAEGQAVKWLGLPAPQTPRWAVGAAEVAGQPHGADPDWLAMGEALALARRAAAAGEVPVGAVVVRGDRIISGAANRSRALGDLTRHAELDALRAATTVAGPYLQDCTLVVTLEPCPMCLGAALEAQVGRVVYGAANPRAGALGGVSDLLSQHWGHVPQVRGGVRATESSRLLRDLFAEVRRTRRGAGDVVPDDHGSAG